MVIRIVCPACQSAYSVPEELRGRKARCRKCDASFLIEGATEQPAPAMPVARAVEKPARPDRRDEDDSFDEPRRKRRQPPKRSSAVVPLLIVGGTVLTLLTAVGAGVGVWAFWKARQDAPPVAGPPGPAPAVPPGAPAIEVAQSFWSVALPPFTYRGTEDGDPDAPPPEAPADDPAGADKPSPDKKPRPTNAGAFVGHLAPEVLQKVKRATFYLRVTMANDQRGTGSGFLVDDTGVVATNAHVLGMLQRETAKPKQIEVLLQSGEPDERKVNAELLGLDRRNDLALLRIPVKDLPPPLRVKSAEELQETQPLWVSGFPFGENLGKNVTLTESKVSSLRKENGVLTRVQVHGDMQPGNSGGPVVDAQGDVVGVSVATWGRTRINLAIPADAVLNLYHGRLAQMALGVPFREGADVRVPVTVNMQDVLHRIRKVAVDLWVGDPGQERVPSTTAPAARKTDAARTQVALAYQAKDGRGKGTLTLPELPKGKVYWLQPVYEDGRGVTHWAAGSVFQPPPAVERKPAVLALKSGGKERALTLHRDTHLRFVPNPTGLSEMGVKMDTGWNESLQPGGATGTWEAQRKYTSLALGVKYNREKQQESHFPEKMSALLTRLQGTVRLDGDLRFTGVDWAPEVAKIHASARNQLTDLHVITQRDLDLLALPLPGKEMAPGATWKPAAPSKLYLETFGVGQASTAALDWTFTYAGVRRHEGREEAVVSLDGALRDEATTSHDKSGRGTGTAVLDLETGQVTRLDANLQLDFSTNMQGFQMPVRGTTTFRLEVGATSSGN